MTRQQKIERIRELELIIEKIKGRKRNDVYKWFSELSEEDKKDPCKIAAIQRKWIEMFYEIVNPSEHSEPSSPLT